jgi:hypothetical protein
MNRRMAPAVQRLPSKCKVLSSNPSTAKQHKTKNNKNAVSSVSMGGWGESKSDIFDTL